jgi:glycosyltransferase involved in cell wall biosynthesis
MALPPLVAEPLVSVLVSCRNYQRFVGACLDSVLRQTYSHFEVIVADDGSEDESRTIVAAIVRKDSRVKLIERPHGGMAASLNAAWEASSGAIICLLDADDTFHREKLAAVVAAFIAHPRAGFLVHRAVRTDMTGRRRGVLPLTGPLPSGWCLAESLEHGGILPNIPPTSNMAIRRQLGEALFPLPEEFVGFAERIIQRLGPFMTELCCVDRPLATWRLHGSNDANIARIDLDRIARDIEVMERLWAIQKEFLDDHAPGLATSLAPLTRSDYYCRLRYIRERFSGRADPERFRVALLESPGFSLRPLLEQWFWRNARRLPDAAVAEINNWIGTQGRIKAMIGNVLRGSA